MSDQQELIKAVGEIEETPVAENDMTDGAVVVSRVAVGPTMSPTDQLIRFALESDVSMEKLEKLINLKNREEDRSAALAFDKKFSAMQKQLPVIKKAKPVYDQNKQLLYYYAPLEDIQRECDEIIAKFGFSYRWREESIEGGKRVTIRISGHGHFEESTFDVPPVSQNKLSNAVQSMGSMTTYGHRYTYIAGFGITVDGTDDDALGFDDGVKYADYFIAMDEETDVNALYELLKNHVADLRNRGDHKGADIMKQYYTKRKKELE